MRSEGTVNLKLSAKWNNWRTALIENLLEKLTLIDDLILLKHVLLRREENINVYGRLNRIMSVDHNE